MKKERKEKICAVIVCCLLFALACDRPQEQEQSETGITEDKAADFDGNGTQESPFLIVTANGLRKLAERVNSNAMYDNDGEESSYREAHYRLTESIDLGGESGEDWVPIGNATNSNTDQRRFFGEFDGGGFVITGLHITSSAANQGLFGVIGNTNIGGKVYNLGVAGIVSGGDNSGGIAGSNFGTVENCYSTVTVTGGNYTGGVVGRNRTNGKILHCYNTGNVSGSGYTGGIVGNNTTSSYVQNCVSLALVVDGGDNIGRIIGNSSGTISNNKARADMLVNSSMVIGNATDRINGADIGIGMSLSSIFSGWDSEVWFIPDGEFTEDGELPRFKR